jgi:hypothetical protein
MWPILTTEGPQLGKYKKKHTPFNSTLMNFGIAIVKRDVHSQSQKCQKCRNLICNCLLTWLWQLEAQPNNSLYKFWRVEIVGYCLECSQIKWGFLGISFDQDRMLVTISIISCNCVVKFWSDVNLCQGTLLKDLITQWLIITVRGRLPVPAGSCSYARAHF